MQLNIKYINIYTQSASQSVSQPYINTFIHTYIKTYSFLLSDVIKFKQPTKAYILRCFPFDISVWGVKLNVRMERKKNKTRLKIPWYYSSQQLYAAPNLNFDCVFFSYASQNQHFMAACLSRVYNVLDLVVLLCNFPVASMERQMAKKQITKNGACFACQAHQIWLHRLFIGMIKSLTKSYAG